MKTGGLCAAIVASLLSFSARANVGLDWIVSQQTPSGAIAAASDIATEAQSTAEAVNALVEFGRGTDAGISDARQFLYADPAADTQSLTRKIVAASITGQSANAFVPALLALQRADGGFGSESGYDASVIDTAHALEALSAARLEASEAAARAVGFLLTRRQSDGSWKEFANESSIILTAASMRALWLFRHHHNVGNAVQAAQTWLLQTRLPNALWYGTYESAAVLHALAPIVVDRATIQGSVDSLGALQLSNGSFDNDVYVTALALRALAGAARTNPDQISIRGRVIDGDTRAPLSDVTIAITGPESGIRVTGPDGQFSFQAFATGSYRVAISKSPYASITVTSTPRPGEAVDIGDVPLLRSSAPLAAILKGRVSDKTTNQAIVGATVQIVERSLTATTNAAGNYEIGDVPAGPATITVSATGYAAAQAMVNFAQAEIYSFSPQLVTASSSKVRVEGTITDSSTGLPLAEVRVAATAANGTFEVLTDAEGRYGIADLDPGSLTVSASKDGYQPLSGATNAPAGARITFSPALTPINSPPPPSSAGAVRAVVLDSVTGQMLAGVTLRVTISGVARTATTNVEGFAQVDNVTGTGTVQLTRSGYTTKQFSITIPSNITLDLGQIELVPTAQGTGGGFKGLVRHGVTDALLGSVSVRATFGATVRTTTSASTGAFQINNITPFDGMVELSRSGFESVTLRVILTAGEVIDLGQIYLRPVGTTEVLGDLSVLRVDAVGVSTDAASFALSGTLRATGANIGTVGLAGNIEALAFSDINNNGQYDEGTDLRVGSVQLPVELTPGASFDLQIPVSGSLPFRDAPLAIFLDSRNALLEQSEANNVETSAGLCTAAAKPAIDLALCLDSSGSVSGADFQLQLQGTAAAVDDASIIPRDGTVRLSVMQFSSSARLEISPTIIDADNFSTISSRIRGIRKSGGGTSIHACVDLAWQTVVNASPMTAVQVIDVSTDGGSSQSAAVAAATRARNAGIDALNALAVGAGANLTVLNAIVFPKTGGEGDGFVVPVANFQEYADALAGKIRRETRSADLTVGGLRVLDNGPGAALSAIARIGNGGARTIVAGETVALYRGAPEAGGVLLQELVLPRLDPGQSVEIRFDGITGLSGGETLVVVADPNRSLAECNINNNRHETVVATQRGAISVVTDRIVYAPNSAVAITSQLSNTGAVSGTFYSTLDILDSGSAVVASFGAQTAGPIPAGAQQIRSETWNTGAFLAGTYRASAKLFLPSGELIDQAEAAFAIQHDAAEGEAFSVRTTTDRSSYNTTDRVQIDDLVRNLTSSTPLPGAEIEVAVQDPNGQTVYSVRVPLGDLSPGAVRELSDTLRLASAPQGTYVVQSRLFDANDQIVASAQTTFEVSEDVAKSLSGTVNAQRSTLFRGELQTCGQTITNTGTQAISALPIRLLSARLDVEAEPAVLAARSINLAAGATQSFSDSFDTDTLEAGDLACIVQAQVDGEWRALDYSNYSLREPAVRVEGSVTVSLPEVPISEAQVCTDTIRNLGDFTVRSLTIRQTLIRAADNQSIINEQSILDLARLGSQTLVRSIATTDLALGDYVCGLDARIDDAWVRLSDASFSVVPPPLRIDASLTLGSRGRLLVLSDDPLQNYDPAPAPDGVSQRMALDRILDALGWSYTIDTDSADFARNLRSGDYDVYALLSEQIKLDNDTQRQVREASYRGEGLIEAGSHDQRNGVVDDALGIKSIGKHSQVAGVELADSALSPGGGYTNLVQTHQNLRAESKGAIRVGAFPGASPDLALSTYTYGLGKSVYAGFDLLVEGSAQGDTGAYAQLFGKALDHVAPPLDTLHTGRVVPVRLTLGNRGRAAELRVVLPLPPGASIADAGGAGVEQGQLVWTLALAEDETRTLQAWVRLPSAAGNLTLIASVGARLTGDSAYDDHTQAEVSLEIIAKPGLTEARSLAASDKTFKQVQNWLDKAAASLAANRPADALSDLTKASDEIVRVTHPKTHDLRLALDEALRSTGRLQ